MSDSTQLKELVALWKEEYLNGNDLPVDQLCVNSPELIPDVERQIGMLRKMIHFAGKVNEDFNQSTNEVPVLNSSTDTRNDQSSEENKHDVTNSLPNPDIDLGFLNPPQKPEELGRFGNDYAILNVLGRGGMGLILKAQNVRLLRLEALKLIRPDRMNNQACRRFIRESQTLASIHHQNVVPIYHIGETEKIPFLTMPLLHGHTLKKRLSQKNKMALSEVVRFAKDIASGLAAAHEKGLIHRDLKPDNIWIGKTIEEGPGEPDRAILLDFGLARPEKVDFALTAEGTTAGTIKYMSPEQANNSELDSRSDLFSLGAVLFEMATGKALFAGETLLGIMSEYVDYNPQSPKEINSEIPDLLSKLITELVEKDRERRPGTAMEVARRLSEIYQHNFCTDDSNISKPAVMQHKEDSNKAQDSGKSKSNQPLTDTIEINSSFEKKHGSSEKPTPQPSKMVEQLGGVVPGSPHTVARRIHWGWIVGVVTMLFGFCLAAYVVINRPTKDSSDTVSHARKGIRKKSGEGKLPTPPKTKQQPNNLWTNNALNSIILGRHRAPLGAVSFGPDGQTLASAGDDTTIKLWDLNTKKEIATLRGHTGLVSAICFSPDGQMLFSSSWDKTIKLWDVERKKEIATFTGHSDKIVSLSVSPDGKTLASGSADKTVKLWDLNNHQELATLTGHQESVKSLRFSPNGQILGSGSWRIKLWNLRKKYEVTDITSNNQWRNDLCFYLDGQTVISAGSQIELWCLNAKSHISTMKESSNQICSISLSPDGKTLASVSYHGTLSLWDLKNRTNIITLKTSGNPVYGVCFSPDGRTLASVGHDSMVKLWNVEAIKNKATPSETKQPKKLWDDTNLRNITLSGHTGSVRSICYSPDGQILASASADKTIRLWNPNTQKEIATLCGHLDSVNALCISPDGKKMFSASADKTIKLWDLDTQKELATLKGHTHWVLSLSISPDGKTLASGSRDGIIKLWHIKNQKAFATFKGHIVGVHALCFSPDGKTLASGSHGLKLWNVSTQSEIVHVRGNGSGTSSFCFSPDGQILVSVGVDKEVRLWDIKKEIEIDTLNGHSDSIPSVCFSPDGKTLASFCDDGVIKLWDFKARKEIISFEAFSDPTHGFVCFSPDGKTLTSCSDDSTIKLWNLKALRAVR